MSKLTNKQKSKTRRELDLDLGVKPPKSIIFTSKKIYNRKKKHKKVTAKMWTCEVTDSYGITHVNYFESQEDASKWAYYIWENEVDPLAKAKAEHWRDDLLYNAIEECVKMDEERGVEPSLD